MLGADNERGYAYPPIVEAVVELRFVEPVTEAQVKKASDRLFRRYDDVRAERQLEGTLEFSLQIGTFRDVGPSFVLSSSDQTNVCTITNSAVAWIRRAPYEGWAAFSGRIAEELAVVYKAWGVRDTSRLGLRYVNRIDVPQSENGLFQYEDYLNYRIEAGDLLQPSSGFQWLIQKDFPEESLGATVQSATVLPELSNRYSFSFDIDVWVQKEVPVRLNDVLSKLETMRSLKNRIFEAGITDKARELYA